MTYACPVGGCNSTHDRVTNLEMHILNSQSGGHEDYHTIGKVRTLIDEEGVEQATDSGGGDGDNNESGGGDNNESGGGDGDPGIDANEDEDGGEGNEDPSTGDGDGEDSGPDGPTGDQGGDGDDEDDEPTCPRCGGNVYFDADGLGYEYGCPSCSEELDGDILFLWNEGDA